MLNTGAELFLSSSTCSLPGQASKVYSAPNFNNFFCNILIWNLFFWTRASSHSQTPSALLWRSAVTCSRQRTASWTTSPNSPRLQSNLTNSRRANEIYVSHLSNTREGTWAKPDHQTSFGISMKKLWRSYLSGFIFAVLLHSLKHSHSL